MGQHIVLTENDESNWHDQTGQIYHFPPRYKSLIEPGKLVVYYKGKLTNIKYRPMRLSAEPHYFGIGEIERVWADSSSKNHFASIRNFKLFSEAVPIKSANGYFEKKANEVNYNYFRGNAVRSITEGEYVQILQRATSLEVQYYKPDEDYNESHTSKVPEGKQTKYYVTKYERIEEYRDAALQIHGYACMVCGMNFKETYGILGEGYIHIHHKKPLYSLEEVSVPDPRTDLVPVCPNCHAMLHRKKGELISIEELRELYKKYNKKKGGEP